ncbi:MAG: ASKHA domain-containing protein [Syntrophobacteraceae bacterium]
MEHRIIFESAGLAHSAGEGETVAEAALALGAPLRSDCGGKGKCGKCRITALPPECLSPLCDEEREALTPEELDSGLRLGCKAGIVGPGVISIPAELLEGGHAFGKTQLQVSWPVDPVIERIVLPPEPLSGENVSASHDMAGKIASRARDATGRDVLFTNHALGEISLPSFSTGELTLVSHAEKGVTSVIHGARSRSLGIALDIGTTTLALYLCDLESGNMLACDAVANPQRVYGEDVISRIAYADEHEDGAARLRGVLAGAVNALSGRVLGRCGAGRDEVDEIVAVGNTTMETLFAGFHPHSLGVAPYLPIIRNPGDFSASELGLDFNPGTNVHLFPTVSGFIGGDTVGAILSERPHERSEISLIIDIGTNGELVLGNRDGLWATSCATGPAFEGAHISHGMRAAPGAIHRVEIDPSTLEASYEVLGDDSNPGIKPRGICGSGIIDALATMRRAGLILANGRMSEKFNCIGCDENGIGRKFVIASSDKTASGREIAVTLQDIRQVQVAKAALLTGIKLLAQKAGFDRIDKMVLTGAFGARFDWRNAVAIGMLPKLSPETRVETVENAAGAGAVKALLDRKSRKEALDLAQTVRFLELAEIPEFQAEFPSAMIFPDLDG